MAEVVERQLLANPSVSSERMVSGAVLIDATTGECFELNRIGAEVWEQIVNGTEITEVITILTRRYGVAENRITSDVGRLIDQLMARGLVRLK